MGAKNPEDPGSFCRHGLQPCPICVRKRSHLPRPRPVDAFSFATGSKTFLDHRDETGKVVNISYTGSEKDSTYYVGNQTKISGFLSAEKDGTKELGDAVQTIIGLRDALNNATPSTILRLSKTRRRN